MIVWPGYYCPCSTVRFPDSFLFFSFLLYLGTRASPLCLPAASITGNGYVVTVRKRGERGWREKKMYAERHSIKLWQRGHWSARRTVKSINPRRNATNHRCVRHGHYAQLAVLSTALCYSLKARFVIHALCSIIYSWDNFISVMYLPEISPDMADDFEASSLGKMAT